MPMTLALGCQDLVTAQAQYIMAMDLQLTFLVTPVTEDVLSDVSKGQSGQWAKFLDIYSQLVDRDRLLRRIAQCCGITDDFYNRYANPEGQQKGLTQTEHC